MRIFEGLFRTFFSRCRWKKKEKAEANASALIAC
jgi:hypothetical protein